MKFTFDIIETSTIRHTVEAETLMEAESKIDEVYSSGSIDIEKYGIHTNNFSLVQISE